ncbi:HYR domain-containing protein [Microbacterium halotolerans]|uniref:HYR domain-containing protein n=1 Tax=Microbacterium halotolerans TaxID=246613 RepID=UPI000E6AB14B|nr:HYR domain-containing protein [Microbacterium halotolerans]
MNPSLAKTRPTLLSLIAVLALMASLFMAPETARADSQSITGTIDASSPTYVRPVTGGCAAGSEETHYAVVKVTIIGTGPTGSLMDFAVTPNGDFALTTTLYDPPFQPDMPIVNCWGANSSSANGEAVEWAYENPITILEGFEYRDFYLVVAGSSAADLGAFTVDVNAETLPVDVEIVPQEPTPDTTAPDLMLPEDVVTEATGPDGSEVSYSASASDDVDGAIAPDCSPAAGTVFPLGSTVVSCTATDDAGNSSSGDFTVTVEDTTPPELVVADDLSVEATASSGAVVDYSVSATDLVSGPVSPVCLPESGSIFTLGETAVSCTATDDAGNASEAGTFVVTVTDVTAPVLDLPADITAEATGASGAIVDYTATAADAVDGAVAVDCIPAASTTFALGTTTVSCSASDNGGSVATGTFDVTVEDSTAPVLDLPDDITAEAADENGAAVAFTASATDLVDGDSAPECDSASGNFFPLGATTVTCTATDEAGNAATGSFDVTVEDTTAPVLHIPDDITAEASGSDGAEVSFVATAQDLVDGAVSPVCAADTAALTSGDTFPLGVTTVTCTAMDETGNAVAGAFDVTVEDTTAPVLSLPDDITAEASGSSGAEVYFVATAEDLVDGAVPPMCTAGADALVSGDTFSVGTTTVTCTATDEAGNVASGAFEVTVDEAAAQPDDDDALGDSVDAEQSGSGATVSELPATGSTVPVAGLIGALALVLGGLVLTLRRRHGVR